MSFATTLFLKPNSATSNVIITNFSLPHFQSQRTLKSRMPNFLINVSNVNKFCEEGRLDDALQMLEHVCEQNIQAPVDTFVRVLKGCMKRKALTEGKRVHSLVVQRGLLSNMFLGNTLINMYGKCGSLLDAHRVFDSMPEHNLFSWTALLSAYANAGQGAEAIKLFQQMQKTGIQPNDVAFSIALKACAGVGSLELGKQLHADIMRRGVELDVILGSTLVDFYAKCGSIELAWEVFSTMSERDVVSWNTMLAGYAQQGLFNQALALYEKMNQEGVQADNITYAVLLKACANIPALEEGKHLHLCIIRSGLESDVSVGIALLDMYTKCGELEHANQVFINMPKRTVMSWTVMISGYCHHGHGIKALDLYQQMKEEGVLPNNVTYVLLLKACASIGALEDGKQLHLEIRKRSFDSDVHVCSTLIDMYSKCGCIELARPVFDSMHERNVVSWNAMMAGYVSLGLGKEALYLYKQMKREGVEADCVTYAVLLKACSSIADSEQGQKLHLDIRRSGFEQDTMVGNTLVDMYAKCGCLYDARQVFDNMLERTLVSWNAIIGGYAQYGYGKEALDLYKRMKNEGVQADSFTSVALLKAHDNIEAAEKKNQHKLDLSCRVSLSEI